MLLLKLLSTIFLQERIFHAFNVTSIFIWLLKVIPTTLSNNQWPLHWEREMQLKLMVDLTKTAAKMLVSSRDLMANSWTLVSLFVSFVLVLVTKVWSLILLDINEHHWKRVEVQLEPMLGYFFTLDPLGFKGDQYLALFMILGNMLMLREQGTFKSEWADWLISDFRKLCTAVKPKVLKYLKFKIIDYFVLCIFYYFWLAKRYLKSGFYANGLLKDDPLEAFMAGPAGRTKQVLQNIMVIVGWADVTEGYDKEKFRLALVEEVIN